MPKQSSTDRQLAKLKAENERLKAELVRKKSAPPVHSRFRWRMVLVVLLAGLAGALLVTGNLLFWTGRTLIETDRYTDIVAPLIEEPSIQNAIATKTTTALFERVDTEQLIAEALPPRAEFLAPTIAGQIEPAVTKQAEKILASDRFAQVWTTTQTRAHERLINAIRNYQGDGTIDLSDVYKALSQNLSETKLSFLANKQLPPKIGSITVVETPNLPKLHWLVVNFNTIRWITIVFFIALTALLIWLAQRKRATVIRLGVLYAFLLFVTLVAVRIGRTITVGKAQPQYQDAVSDAWQIIFHNFVIQTATLLVAALLMALIAWVTGASRSAAKVRERLELVFSGKIHSSIFKHENGFTLWLGRYQRTLQWIIVASGAISLLFMKLTLGNLLWVIILVLIGVILIDILSADKKASV